MASRWLGCLGTTVLSLLRSCGAGLVTVAFHGGRHWCSPIAGGTFFQVGVQSCRGVGVVRVVPVSGPPFPVVFGVCVVVPPVPRLLAACFPAVLVRCWYVLNCGFSLYFWCAVAALGERSAGQSVILVSVGYSVVFKSSGVNCITPLC